MADEHPELVEPADAGHPETPADLLQLYEVLEFEKAVNEEGTGTQGVEV